MKHPCLRCLAALIALFAGATVLAETHDRLRISVDVEGDEVEPAVVKEVVKRNEKRDKWFSMAEDREDSDVVVTLRRQWKEKRERTSYEWQDPAMGAHAGEVHQMGTMPVLEDVFFVEAEIRIGEDPPAVVKQSGRRAKEAAKALVRDLETWCMARGLLSR